MLYCVVCGCCSGALGKGWTALHRERPGGSGPPAVALYCPPCAAGEFGYRPDVAERYVCAWEPAPGEPAGNVLPAPDESERTEGV